MHDIVTQNRLQFWNALVRHGGYQKHPDSVVPAARSFATHPSFNYAFSEAQSSPCPDTRRMARFFGPNPFYWWVQPHHTSLALHLRREGLRHTMHTRAMHRVLHREPDPPPVMPHAEVCRITGETERRTWIQTASRFYGIPLEDMGRLCPPLDQEDISFYTGTMGNTPASLGVVFYGTMTAGLYWMGTFPAYRRQGMARQLVAHMLRDIWHRQYRMVILQASPEAVPLYESCGFQTAGQYILYLMDPRGGERQRSSEKNFEKQLRSVRRCGVIHP